MGPHQARPPAPGLSSGQIHLWSWRFGVRQNPAAPRGLLLWLGVSRQLPCCRTWARSLHVLPACSGPVRRPWVAPGPWGPALTPRRADGPSEHLQRTSSGGGSSQQPCTQAADRVPAFSRIWDAQLIPGAGYPRVRSSEQCTPCSPPGRGGHRNRTLCSERLCLSRHHPTAVLARTPTVTIGCAHLQQRTAPTTHCLQK